MSESVRIWMEISFNIVYLIVVWGLVIAMIRKRSAVIPENQRAADLVLAAFALLALGDTGHVGFRVFAYAQGGLDAQLTLASWSIGLVGLGALSTSITVTLFYVMMLELWRVRYDRKHGWFEYLLLAAAVFRLVIMLLPVNEWNRVVPLQPWSTIRNMPLTLVGLGVAYLIMRDARKTGDSTFIWIGTMILVSYACYIPVILFVQQIPMIGMLMIPKTMAYVAIGFLAYNELYRQPSRIASMMLEKPAA
ncbi:MAG: hypothetical protein PVF74_12930 [Anaerolineales bacterium]|jgi:hypothetical protein